jgi:hypothetical protein
MKLKNESEFQSWVTRWLAAEAVTEFRSLYVGIVYELKVVRCREGKDGEVTWSLPPSAFKSHQLPELLRAVGIGSGEGEEAVGIMAHKISDSAIGYKPFDGFAMWGKRDGLEERKLEAERRELLRVLDGEDLGSEWEAGRWKPSVASYVGIGEVLGSYAWFIPSWVIETCYRSNKRVSLGTCRQLCGKFGVFCVRLKDGEVWGARNKKLGAVA